MKAQELLRERNEHQGRTSTASRASTSTSTTAELITQKWAYEEGPTTSAFAEAEAARSPAPRPRWSKMEFQRMLSGAHDKANCFVEINAGAGGTESQDWASRCCCACTSRYCRAQRLEGRRRDIMPATTAGIKSAVIRVEGDSRLRLPEGRERRPSPGAHLALRRPEAPPDQLRQRFAVLPEVDDSIEIDLREGDLRGHLPRQSGAGGQHVNKTDSAVRLTHKPTGIVVECQAERSQHKNRDAGDEDAEARSLYEVELAKKTETSATCCTPAKPRSTSAARSAATCCIPTRWSRTSGRAGDQRYRRCARRRHRRRPSRPSS
jgi:peptide chain release factor 2